jgi:CsoR family transcriptional regulator, copper-sensing transcriptional repressor
MGPETQAEQRKRTIGRLHRIQGQLAALERDIEADHTCEDLVTQAMAIEKAMSSLVIYIIEGHLSHETKSLLEENPEQAFKEIKRLFELISR